MGKAVKIHVIKPLKMVKKCMNLNKAYFISFVTRVIENVSGQILSHMGLLVKYQCAGTCRESIGERKKREQGGITSKCICVGVRSCTGKFGLPNVFDCRLVNLQKDMILIQSHWSAAQTRRQTQTITCKVPEIIGQGLGAMSGKKQRPAELGK